MRKSYNRDLRERLDGKISHLWDLFFFRYNNNVGPMCSVGAVLSQVKAGSEQPILFLSRKLQPAERNYSATEKEALAIKRAVGALQFYLSHKPFSLVVNHAPLMG